MLRDSYSNSNNNTNKSTGSPMINNYSGGAMNSNNGNNSLSSSNSNNNCRDSTNLDTHAPDEARARLKVTLGTIGEIKQNLSQLSETGLIDTFEKAQTTPAFGSPLVDERVKQLLGT